MFFSALSCLIFPPHGDGDGDGDDDDDDDGDDIGIGIRLPHMLWI